MESLPPEARNKARYAIAQKTQAQGGYYSFAKHGQYPKDTYEVSYLT